MCSTAENYTTDFCLDFSIDYCDGTPSTKLRAIINDESLKSDRFSTIFGADAADSGGAKLLKQVGYPISIVALFLTIVIFFLVSDLRKVNGSKVKGQSSKVKSQGFLETCRSGNDWGNSSKKM